MRNLRMPIGALLAVLGALILWNCRGKEGPQGPPGRDLTRLQEGYIRGTVKGRDTTRNQDFQLSFNYTYVSSIWSPIPGTWTPQSNDLDTIAISMFREGERGGYMSIELKHKKSTNTTWVTNLEGDLLDISSSPASRYRLNYYPPSQDTAYVTSLTLRGDTLVSGQLIYVKRRKTPADTAKVEFSSQLYRIIPYQRQGQAQKLLLQQAQ